MVPTFSSSSPPTLILPSSNSFHKLMLPTFLSSLSVFGGGDGGGGGGGGFGGGFVNHFSASLFNLSSTDEDLAFFCIAENVKSVPVAYNRLSQRQSTSKRVMCMVLSGEPHPAPLHHSPSLTHPIPPQQDDGTVQATHTLIAQRLFWTAQIGWIRRRPISLVCPRQSTIHLHCNVLWWARSDYHITTLKG